jgi:fructokinase
MAEGSDHRVLVAGDTLVDVMADDGDSDGSDSPDGSNDSEGSDAPDGPAGIDGDGRTDGGSTLTPSMGLDGRFGGSGANVAVALARIGVAPLFWTRLAEDAFGDFLGGVLADSDIPGDFLVRDPVAKTTLAIVTHDAGGEPTFEFYREGTADTRMQPGTIPDDVLEDVSWVHLTGVTLSVEPSRTATLDLAERANDRGCTVSLDPNARPEMWASDEEFGAVVRGALGHVDVLKATPGDLAVAGFDDAEPEALAQAVCEHGPDTALLTLGDDGALVYGTERSPLAGVTRHPGYEADAVDTTGAGDGFLAGAIAAIVHGVADPKRVLALANAVGAVTTTRRGSVTALTGVGPVRELCGDVPWA